MKNKSKLGMLLGLHAGDSLGATLEFTNPRDLSQFHTEITGGGSFNWSAGAPTDDTQMMICLLESLVEKKGKVCPEDIMNKYLEWYRTEPLDMGNTVRQALVNYKRGAAVESCGLSDEYSQGNGALMRCAPLALVNASDEEIFREAALTHAHPNCKAANLVFIRALEDILAGMCKDEVYKKALARAKSQSNDVAMALKTIPEMPWDEVPNSGFVLDSLTAAFWGFYHKDSFEEALISVVNRGGDADTNGAICGALCGAFYGVENIPQRWLQMLQAKESIEYLLEQI